MAWSTPKTDRTDVSLFTYEDINRIGENIIYLYEQARFSLKTDYTQDDIISISQWRTVISLVNVVCALYSVRMITPITEEATSSNFNQVESYLELCYIQKERQAMVDKSALKVGMGLSVNAPQIQLKGIS